MSFTILHENVRRLQRHLLQCDDLLVNPQHLDFMLASPYPEGNRGGLDTPSVYVRGWGALSLTPKGHRALARLFRIPTEYSDRMYRQQPDLWVASYHAWRESVGETPRLLRIKNECIRGVMSSSYRRRDNFYTLTAVENLVRASKDLEEAIVSQDWWFSDNYSRMYYVLQGEYLDDVSDLPSKVAPAVAIQNGETGESSWRLTAGVKIEGTNIVLPFNRAARRHRGARQYLDDYQQSYKKLPPEGLDSSDRNTLKSILNSALTWESSSLRRNMGKWIARYIRVAATRRQIDVSPDTLRKRAKRRIPLPAETLNRIIDELTDSQSPDRCIGSPWSFIVKVLKVAPEAEDPGKVADTASILLQHAADVYIDAMFQ